jgi:hypothetical protein
MSAFIQTSCAAVVLAISAGAIQAELPSDEAGIIALFEKAGARLTLDDDGHVVKIFSGGKPPHSTAELQLLGKLPHLEQIALNAPQAGDDEWGFLQKLPKLKRLTIWHCKTFTTLAPFRDLKIEALTVGGCMGLRDLNRDDPEKQRDAVLSLTGLPNLTYLNLYHSPLIPDDSHLAHIAEQFPKLEELKIDFAAPRGSETNITPEGLQQLLKLPLKLISMENAQTFTPAHMEALAKIKTLEAVLIDNRRGGVDTATLDSALKAARPGLEVVVANEGASAPPSRSRK